MVRRVSSPDKLRSQIRRDKAMKRMGSVDTKTRTKVKRTISPVKPEKGTTLDDCNLDELILN